MARQLSLSTALFISGTKSVRGANLSWKNPHNRKPAQMLNREGIWYRRPWQILVQRYQFLFQPGLPSPGCSWIQLEWLLYQAKSLFAFPSSVSGGPPQPDETRISCFQTQPVWHEHSFCLFHPFTSRYSQHLNVRVSKYSQHVQLLTRSPFQCFQGSPLSLVWW